jgi:hypothetical protein
VLELRKSIDNEKYKNRKCSEVSESLKLQLNVYRDSMKPMQAYINSLTDDYNKLQ